MTKNQHLIPSPVFRQEAQNLQAIVRVDFHYFVESVACGLQLQGIIAEYLLQVIQALSANSYGSNLPEEETFFDQ